MASFDTPNADHFRNSLKFDAHGNLIGSTRIPSNVHTMTLNHPHKSSRNITEERRLENVKDDLASVKTRIVDNIVDNVKDQCGDGTYYFSWSGLDLEMKISPDERKARLKDVITLFCTERIHTVAKYANRAEVDTIPDVWEGYKVHLHYPQKISCTEAEMWKEVDGSLKMFNSLWLQEINSSNASKKERSLLNVWKRFLDNHSMEYPNVCQLVQIMIATAGNTSPLERGYTHHQMVTSKRRNRINPDNLEVLFLLATLKIPVKKPDQYVNEIKRLNGK